MADDKRKLVRNEEEAVSAPPSYYTSYYTRPAVVPEQNTQQYAPTPYATQYAPQQGTTVNVHGQGPYPAPGQGPYPAPGQYPYAQVSPKRITAHFPILHVQVSSVHMPGH